MSKRENTESVVPPASDGVIVGEGVTLEVRAVPWALRVAGGAIDVVVLIIGYSLTSIAVGMIGLRIRIDPYIVRSLTIMAAVFFFLVIPITVERLTHGRSLGKIAIGGRIVRRDGGGITVWHSAVRALAGVCEIFACGGSLAIVTSFFAPRSERLGDLLAGTYSQLERVPASPALSSAVPRGLEAWAARVDAGRMPAALDRRVSAFLRHAPTMQPRARDTVALELARELVPFVSEVPDCTPATFIAGVHAVRAARDARALRAENQRLDRVRSLVAKERSV